MKLKTEKDIILYYLNNLLKHPMYGNVEERICDWFEENSRELIGKDVEDIWDGRRKGWKRKEDGDDKTPLPRDAKTIRKLLEGKKGNVPVSPEVSALVEAFHFSPEYREFLALRVHIAHIPQLHDLAESRRTTNPSMRLMAAMLNMPMKRYEKFYSHSSELVEKGLFKNNRHRDWDSDSTEMFSEILLNHCRTPEAVRRTVLGKPQRATLKPEHFEHLEDEYVWLRNLLSNALAKKRPGVNVLIYGKPGTGKTEMAKTLCREIGVSLYSVSGNVTEERNGPGRRSDLAAALSVLQDDRNSVLLMDEAEDVFGVSPFHGGLLGLLSDPDQSSRKSKLYFNRLLERNTVPVIWISNNVRGVDPAHLRRFSYALDMEAPNETVQARIWSHSARKNRVRLPKEKIDHLVRSYDIAPGIIDASLRTAALTGDQDAIEKTIESLQTAMTGHSVKKRNVREHEFSPALLNCDVDLENLARRILELKGVNFSLCLYGIPGSGKSAYARYLAERMKMKVLHKRASDLINPFVGMTERLIAEAFAEARKKKMLLVLDEADSFLQDRRGAHRSWEVTQVNEMLTQMESHPLPFVCTTNLMDDLDQASLRRFTFKVKYDFLKREQAAAAFRHFFGTDPTVSLTGLNCLTPGDFAVVAKKARICGIDDQHELVTMLRQEQDVKDVRRGSLGFSGS